MPTLIDAPMLSALVQRYPFSPQSWQGKCITLTQGNRSLTGTILLAVLGQTPPGPPAFGTGAVIDADGVVHCDFLRPAIGDQPSVLVTGQTINTIEAVTEAFRRVADTLKLPDDEREKLFLYLRGWIKRDFRAKPAMIGERTRHDPK